MTREPWDTREPGELGEPDQLGELLRHGLGRLADETPRYVDTSQLRETVVARAHQDRTSKRMMAAAAALVPLAAVAGWAIGNAGGSGGATGELGAGTPGAVVASAGPTHSPTPTPTPTPSATTHVAPPASATPTHVAVPVGPPASTPTVTVRVTPTATPTVSPGVGGPDALVVSLEVTSGGRVAGGYRAHYSITFSGGSKAPVSVLLYQGDKILSQQPLGGACDGPPFGDDVSGDVVVPGPGPYLFTGVVKAGCAGAEDRQTDKFRWTWTAPAATPTPTPTPTSSQVPTSTPTASPTSSPGGSPAATASPSPDPTLASAPGASLGDGVHGRQLRAYGGAPAPTD